MAASVMISVQDAAQISNHLLVSKLIYNVFNFADGGAMTELLYQTDAYLQEFDANIVNVYNTKRRVCTVSNKNAIRRRDSRAT